jgi:hypothetical protein
MQAQNIRKVSPSSNPVRVPQSAERGISTQLVLHFQTYLFLYACAVNHLYSQSDPTKMLYGEHVLTIGVAKRA